MPDKNLTKKKSFFVLLTFNYFLFNFPFIYSIATFLYSSLILLTFLLFKFCLLIFFSTIPLPVLEGIACSHAFFHEKLEKFLRFKVKLRMSGCFAGRTRNLACSTISRVKTGSVALKEPSASTKTQNKRFGS